MRKSMILPAVLVAIAVCQGMSLAAPTGSHTALPLAKAITLDGLLGDWDMAAYGQPTFILDPAVSYVRAAAFTDAKENSGKVFVAYDAKYLYLGVDMVDSAIKGDASGSGIWGNTNVEVWLNGGDIAIPTLVAGAEAYEEQDFQVDLAVMSDGEKVPAQWVYSHGLDGDSGVKLAVKYTATGYTLEAAIPKAEFAGLDAFKAGGKYAMAISTVHFVDDAWGGLFSPGPGWDYAPITIR